MPVSVLPLAASAAIRAASLDLCADEYLLLLARPGEIASVSRVAQDPADSPLWRAARAHPGSGRDLESILATHPNLLVTMGGGGRATGLIAAKLHLRTLRLAYPASIAAVEATMVEVAAALGDVHRADRWRARLARLRAPPRGKPRDAIFLGSGGTSLAAGSIGAQWMALAGLRQRALPGARASLETLATAPPQLLLRSTYRRDQPSLGQRWLDHPLARRSTARTVDVDGRPWTCAGPLMLGEIERLRALR